MGSEVARVRLDDNAVILVKVASEAEGREPVSKYSFHDLAGVVTGIEQFAKQILDAVGRANPTKTTVEFGVGFEFEAGKLAALVCDASADGSLKITLEWTRSSE